ncbi:MAG: hypothetical protein JJ872_11805 [Marivivens sp.]|nr:hypothetical protein [Marivivens sp.]
MTQRARMLELMSRREKAALAGASRELAVIEERRVAAESALERLELLLNERSHQLGAPVSVASLRADTHLSGRIAQEAQRIRSSKDELTRLADEQKVTLSRHDIKTRRYTDAAQDARRTSVEERDARAAAAMPSQGRSN